VYGGAIPHRNYNVQALDLLWLEEKCRSRRMGHTGGSTANLNFSANLNLYSKRLKDMNQGVGGRNLMKKKRQNFSRQCPFKDGHPHGFVLGNHLVDFMDTVTESGDKGTAVEIFYIALS
jgi:hypothetical protein